EGEVIGEPRTESAKWVSWRTVRDEFDIALGSLDARGTGLGGWELDVHHAYDARMRTLYRGDGLQVGAERVLDAFAKTHQAGDPRDADIAPDGSVWVANAATDQILRFDPQGNMTVMAGSTGGGGGCENCFAAASNAKASDDPLAKGYPLARPMSVALAPDGSFYIADYLVDYGVQTGYIYRVDPEGRIRHIAGCMCTAFGDGGPAKEASMTPLDLAVGPDGTLYLADYKHARIRAIDADGTIRTVAGGGSEDTGYQDGIPGTRARLFEPHSIEIGPEGELYFADNGRSPRVRRLDPDGTVTTVAGGNPFNADNGDGGPATEANLHTTPQALALGPDGNLYIGDFDRIRRVGSDGVITTVVGGGPDNATGANRVPAGSVRFTGVMGLDIAPDGSTFVASPAGVSRISRPFPATRDGALSIPSKDGREVYFFDARGRHLRTVDGLTGVALWRFGYDDAGRLSTVTDADDRVTRIERDGDGRTTAIVAPSGQRTALAIEGDHLTRVEDPAGKATRLGYDASGRLAWLVDRRGGRHEFVYDGSGRLVRDQAPNGKAQTLSRKETDNGYIVTHTSPEGRKTTYELGLRPDGDAFMEVTDPSGAKTVSWIGIDGVRHQTFPNGETIELEQDPDPRWGFYVPVTSRIVRRSPEGRTQVTTAARTVTLADVGDPLSVKTITDLWTTNGRKSSVSYDAEQRKETLTSAEGEITSNFYDTRNRVVRVEPGDGVAPISYEYDDNGMLRRATQAGRSIRWEPDGRGRPAVQIDAENRRTEVTFDDNDRVIAIKRPGGGIERFEYDAEGARTAVITPNGKRHELDRDARGALAGYKPAVGATVARERDGDGRLTAEGVDGDRLTYGYEKPGGRATGATWADAVVEYGYDGATNRPDSLKRTPVGGGTAEVQELEYDGAQTTGITISGTAQGAYTLGYDNDGFLTSSKLVSGAQTVTTALKRDKDGRLTGNGPFTIARDGIAGMASAITGGGLNQALDYDDAGRLKSRTVTVGSTQRYKLELERSDAGRITRRTETIGTETHTYDYTYDDDGQLLEVERDKGTAQAAVIERYEYDVNGNRKSRQIGSEAAETATFDDEDRLKTRGATAYDYDVAGFLKSRGADQFDYSARGELLSATVGGTTVTYRYDALGRRVARVQGDQTTQYLYGDPSNPVRVTATRSPAGVLTTYYYDDEGMLFAFERSGQRFYVATDQVGTPRVVTNSAGVVQTVRTYDAFGHLLHETQPAFDLPIGYAGGLEDRVTGLVRFGFRDLDTISGRWTARDPALYDGGQANLYTYVSGDPVSLRDPLGLWCIGGSVYEGVGAGATICHTDEGTAVCFEVGFGFGLNAGLDNGKLPPDGESIVAEAKASVNGFGVGIGGELNNCGEVSNTGSIDLLALNVNVGDGTLQLQPPSLGASAQIKVAAKVCRRLG
ncbi:MAG TPA: RHS repeat-associated core domain-containing protein, partial [Solirubrobacter sp.]|nr:RHS repeat-associated core domain-containing protein [Solirubrobacter sp.]